MRIWTVHTDRGVVTATPAQGGMAAAAEEVGTPPASRRPPVLVREGFSWLAFLFGLPWLLWHRLWLAALLYVVLALAIAALLPGGPGFVAGLALQVLLGAHANDLRRRRLARRGYVEAGVVAARNIDGAIARLLAERPDLAILLARELPA